SHAPVGLRALNERTSQSPCWPPEPPGSLDTSTTPTSKARSPVKSPGDVAGGGDDEPEHANDASAVATRIHGFFVSLLILRTLPRSPARGTRKACGTSRAALTSLISN